VVAGGTVQVTISGFSPNAEITLWFDAFDRGERTAIGAGTTGDDGTGLVTGIIPADAWLGEADIDVEASDGCWAQAFIEIVLSPRAISIDDVTVRPGQQVTVRAGGFVPKSPILLSIDSAPVQGECWPHPCVWLGEARSTDRGAVVFRVRIPRDTSLGRHTLVVSGDKPDGLSENYLTVEVTVVAGATLPPTDTE
jgi:hypothetical protein